MTTSTVIDFLRGVQTLARPRPGFVYSGVYDFIARCGQSFPVAADQTLGKFHAWPQGCFDNAYRLAKRWPARYRYVEGLAQGVFPVHHAWVITSDGEVIDPTWHQHSTVGTDYFGVIIPLALAARVRHRRNASIIDNYQRKWPLLRAEWSTLSSEVLR